MYPRREILFSPQINRCFTNLDEVKSYLKKSNFLFKETILSSVHMQGEVLGKTIQFSLYFPQFPNSKVIEFFPISSIKLLNFRSLS